MLELSADAMPQKIRELKARLSKAGFFLSRTRGSHTVWNHPTLVTTVVLAGKDGNDAKPYQVRDVEAALKALKDM
ncbi:MAG: type II toxin-antitoxin system HicA family toxin [Ktedonobacteraceae bacterium]|nr:type II toxin-antitoxin system HicA family toxin [Ktedonobacteraceae bacterium]